MAGNLRQRGIFFLSLLPLHLFADKRVHFDYDFLLTVVLNRLLLLLVTAVQLAVHILALHDDRIASLVRNAAVESSFAVRLAVVNLDRRDKDSEEADVASVILTLMSGIGFPLSASVTRP